MEEKINNILAMYEECFKGLDCSPLDAEKFALRFYINYKDAERTLIEMLRRIYHQRQILKEFCEVYSDSCDDFRELWERLYDIHQEIFKVLKKDFGMSDCLTDEEMNEIEFMQTI